MNNISVSRRTIGNAFYVANLVATFAQSGLTPVAQEVAVAKIDTVKSIRTLNWCINTVGYVVLEWKGKPNSPNTPIVVLSGNGRWDLGFNLEYHVPETSTGQIILTTVGFDNLDSYSIIIAGEY